MHKGPEVERVRHGSGYEHLCSSSSYFGNCQSHPFHNEREHVTQAGQTENAAYFTLIFLKNVNGTVLGHSAPWESD